MKKVAFFFSGRGSLLTSVLDAIRDSREVAELGLILTNNINFNPHENIAFADRSVVIVNHRDYDNRFEFENEISKHIIENNIDLIVLGGFRRIFSAEFVKSFGHMIMNTHPSLLPAFPGDKAQLQALQAGVRITGATLHFINDEVDAGPIIDQEPVRVINGMTESDLKEAIINSERTIIYNAVCAYLEGRIKMIDSRVFYEGYSECIK